ncbi:MAG: prolyl oligopeptidase family serine peptidase [Alphaproteobacteria bacterium]|nr:prolyl oligopeptidase family serine peptidase [Alphaproteobacteria bacterium]
MKKCMGIALLAVIVGISPICSAEAATAVTESFRGRDMIVYAPDHLPPNGKRALIIVLHGGMGNAERIATTQSESGLNMNAEADKDGFVVAYLNGTKVARFLRSDRRGWNAGGGCCGMPAETNVDDETYIAQAVAHLADEYGIDTRRVYGMGHSNGAMMTQRLMCDTGLYAAAVAVSGPLNLDTATCPAARGRRILAIHGAEDENVPVAGGEGSKGFSHATFKSEAHSRQVFTNSGAAYTLDLVPGADHAFAHIDAALKQTEGVTIAEKSAGFFGLAAAR